MARTQDGGGLVRLVEIMRRLLAPDGCPWDREQTLSSLRPYVIEEAHEVAEAIDRGTPADLCEELGDLLLQIVFQSELAQAQGWFTLEDVIGGICDKMERRHPHVFQDARADDAQQVREQWEAIKRREKAGRGLLEGVPATLPGLLRALRLGQKASRAGLDWPDVGRVRQKVDEELGELDAACTTPDTPEGRKAIDQELGDLLFATANLARKLDSDPEAALQASLNRFEQRVGTVEALARERNQELFALSEAALDELWKIAKGRVG